MELVSRRYNDSGSAAPAQQAQAAACPLQQPIAPNARHLSPAIKPLPPLDADWWRHATPECSPKGSGMCDVFSSTESYPNPSLLWSTAAVGTCNTSRDCTQDSPSHVTCSFKHSVTPGSSAVTAGGAVPPGAFGAAGQNCTSAFGWDGASDGQGGSPHAMHAVHAPPEAPVDTGERLAAISTELSGESSYSPDAATSALLSRVTLEVQSQLHSFHDQAASAVALQHSFAALQPPAAMIPVHTFLAPIKVNAPRSPGSSAPGSRELASHSCGVTPSPSQFLDRDPCNACGAWILRAGASQLTSLPRSVVDESAVSWYHNQLSSDPAAPRQAAAPHASAACDPVASTITSSVAHEHCVCESLPHVQEPPKGGSGGGAAATADTVPCEHSFILTSANCALEDTLPSIQSTASSTRSTCANAISFKLLPLGRVSNKQPGSSCARGSFPMHECILPPAAPCQVEVFHQRGDHGTIDGCFAKFSVTENPLHSPQYRHTRAAGDPSSPQAAADADAACAGGLIQNPLFSSGSQLVGITTMDASAASRETYARPDSHGSLCAALPAQHTYAQSFTTHSSRSGAWVSQPAAPRHSTMSSFFLRKDFALHRSLPFIAETADPSSTEAAPEHNATSAAETSEVSCAPAAAEGSNSCEEQGLQQFSTDSATHSCTVGSALACNSSLPLCPDLQVYGTCRSGDGDTIMSSCRSSAAFPGFSSTGDSHSHIQSHLLTGRDKLSSQSTIGVRRARHIWVVKPKSGPGRVPRAVLQDYMKQMVGGIPATRPWIQPPGRELPALTKGGPGATVVYDSGDIGYDASATIERDDETEVELNGDTMQVLLYRGGEQASKQAGGGGVVRKCFEYAVKRVRSCFTGAGDMHATGEKSR